MKTRSLGPGLAVAIAILIADQITKQLALTYLSGGPSVEVTSFFNLVLVWNTGVSFGMFQSGGDTGRWILIALACAISLVLVVLLAREQRSLTRLAYWLVLAGAVGNVIDRLRFGAVVDFLDFHAGGYHWPAFNIADSAIVIGAGLLLLDTFRSETPEATTERKT